MPEVPGQELERWSEIEALSTEELESWLRDERQRPVLEEYFGKAEYSRLRKLATLPRTGTSTPAKRSCCCPGSWGRNSPTSAGSTAGFG